MKYLKTKPREYQEKIFQTCAEKNCLVVLPTGLGKTLIALMLTIHRMQQFPGEKVLFLAPTKPLVEQHIKTFRENLPELFANMELFTGKTPSPQRKKLWQTSDIIFSTPQCISNDLKKELYDLSEVCLLVEDEAHRCVNNYSYNFVAQKYLQQAMHKRILGLTASPGSDLTKVKNICKNLSIEAVELRTRESEDVKPYLQELTFKKIKTNLSKEFKEMKAILKELFHEYVSELKKRKLLWSNPSKTELIKLQKNLSVRISQGNRNYNNLLGMSACAIAIKLQHAIELLETQTLVGFNTYLKKLFVEASKSKSRGISKLVSNPQFNFVFSKSSELLIKNEEHPKIDELLKIIKEEKKEKENLKAIVFAQYRETLRLISKKLNQIKGIKAKTFVGQAKKLHGKETSGLSQKEQKSVIENFAEGKTNILCATSIGEEGLDIPEVDMVIFYEPVPSAIRAIQRAGRTARLKPGKLIMLITRETRDEIHFYVERHKRKQMRSAIESIEKDIKGKDLKKETQKTL